MFDITIFASVAKYSALLLLLSISFAVLACITIYVIVDVLALAIDPHAWERPECLPPSGQLLDI